MIDSRQSGVVVIVFLSLIILGVYSAIPDKGKTNGECHLPQNVIQDIAGYANVTNHIIDYFTKGPYKGQSWKHLANFVDKFGNRISGSQSLEDAIDYMVNISIENGLENVHTEDVEVPYWVRGEESAMLLKPRIKSLRMLGLGGSVGTPPEGITAQVIVVQNFEELHALSDDKVNGKLIVYTPKFTTYHSTVQYRLKGASEAAKKGAVAALVQSITPYSHATPHTGLMEYDDSFNKIPIAAITCEDADQLLRMQISGYNLTIKLTMSATSRGTKVSRNTIADLKGSTLEKKVVFVSGHLDSWDVGDGAMDDGGGAFISWVAPVVLKNLNLRPRRTLRTILWTGEEQGFIGAIAYEKAHKDDNDDLNFVMESDYGTFSPLGLMYSGSKTGECMMKEILKLFESINATQLILTEPGPDISFWTNQGIPGGGFHNENEKYFWYHHSEADSMNLIETDAFDRSAAFWTAFSYIVADLQHDIPRND